MDLIVGYGVVGKATAYAYNIKNWVDKNGSNFENQGKIDFLWICVPTPTVNNKQDLTEVENVISRYHYLDPIFILRSTVLPGTTTKLEEKYGIKIVFMPEFLTEVTAFDDAKYPEIVLIGGNDVEVNRKVKIRIGSGSEVKPETAELVKYAMNTFFGTKVVLGNVFRDIAEETGANYWTVREALESHRWGSKNGWNPFHGNKRGFGGKCLPKDIEAISSLDETGFLKKLLKVNEEYREK